MNRYFYSGPVMEFGRCVSNHYEATTFAPSRKEALSNIIFKFKRECGKHPFSKISLDETKLTLMN